MNDTSLLSLMQLVNDKFETKVDKRLTINGKKLNGNIVLTPNDIPGLNVTQQTNTVTPQIQAELIKKVDVTRTINGLPLNDNIILTSSIIPGCNNIDNTSDYDKPVSLQTQQALDNKVSTSTMINGHSLTNNINLTKYDIGLGNVDNILDSDKPVHPQVQLLLNMFNTILNTNSTSIGMLNNALSSYVMKSQTLNGMPLTGNIVLDKTSIGLNNVDNVSDQNKPISTLVEAELLLREVKSDKNVSNGYAGLDNTGKLNINQLPLMGLNYNGTWDAQTNNPPLVSGTGVSGNYYIVSVPGVTFLDNVSSWNVGDHVVFNGSVWERIPSSTSVTTVNSYSGVVTLAKADIGLNHVDNTSDVNKPVSNATAILIDALDDIVVKDIVSSNPTLLNVSKVNNTVTLTQNPYDISNYNELYQSVITTQNYNGNLDNFGTVNGWLNNVVNMSSLLINSFGNDPSKLGIMRGFLPRNVDMFIYIYWSPSSSTESNTSTIYVNGNIASTQVTPQSLTQTVTKHELLYLPLDLQNTVNVFNVDVNILAGNNITFYEVGIKIH